MAIIKQNLQQENLSLVLCISHHWLGSHIAVFIDVKKITSRFVGARSASSIVNEAMNVLKQTVDDRLAGRGGSRGKV